MGNDLVSIIMLSHGDGTYVVDSVKSILAQTYQNWELLFVAKTDNDESLKPFSLLREEDIKIQKMAGKVLTDSYSNSRIKVSYIVGEDNDTPRRNSALANAQGRWIAFLDAGDIWEPTKLEKQIGFMEEHGYAFSYTQYGIIDKDSHDRGFVIGGKDRVTYQDMMKCCWPAYMTVMYDATKIGLIQIEDIKKNNDYAMWLKVCKKADCYLLPEVLAKYRRGRAGSVSTHGITTMIGWHYKLWREAEKRSVIASLWLTDVNLVCGLYKKKKYVIR